MVGTYPAVYRSPYFIPCLAPDVGSDHSPADYEHPIGPVVLEHVVVDPAERAQDARSASEPTAFSSADVVGNCTRSYEFPVNW